MVSMAQFRIFWKEQLPGDGRCGCLAEETAGAVFAVDAIDNKPERTIANARSRGHLLYTGGVDGTRLRAAGRGNACKRFPSCPAGSHAGGSLHSAQRKTPAYAGVLLLLAEWTGLEPATPGVTGRYSNQLNYHSLTAETFACAVRTGWWVLRGSNSRPTPCKGAALPTELSTRCLASCIESRRATLCPKRGEVYLNSFRISSALEKFLKKIADRPPHKLRRTGNSAKMQEKAAHAKTRSARRRS